LDHETGGDILLKYKIIAMPSPIIPTAPTAWEKMPVNQRIELAKKNHVAWLDFQVDVKNIRINKWRDIFPVSENAPKEIKELAQTKAKRWIIDKYWIEQPGTFSDSEKFEMVKAKLPTTINAETFQFDIAGTSEYENLPPYWQNNNLQEAEVLVNSLAQLREKFVDRAPENTEELYDMQLKIASTLHEQWRARNRTERAGEKSFQEMDISFESFRGEIIKIGENVINDFWYNLPTKDEVLKNEIITYLKCKLDEKLSEPNSNNSFFLREQLIQRFGGGTQGEDKLKHIQGVFFARLHDNPLAKNYFSNFTNVSNGLQTLWPEAFRKLVITDSADNIRSVNNLSNLQAAARDWSKNMDFDGAAILFGGADGLTGNYAEKVQRFIDNTFIPLLQKQKFIGVTGGVNTGVIQQVGDSADKHEDVTLVGVVPGKQLVTSSNENPSLSYSHSKANGHNTIFAVGNASWQFHENMVLPFAQAICNDGVNKKPLLLVFANGGKKTAQEFKFALQSNSHITILADSGRLSSQVAHAWMMSRNSKEWDDSFYLECNEGQPKETIKEIWELMKSKKEGGKLNVSFENIDHVEGQETVSIDSLGTRSRVSL
jgi:hypothetical protein